MIPDTKERPGVLEDGEDFCRDWLEAGLGREAVEREWTEVASGHESLAQWNLQTTEARVLPFPQVFGHERSSDLREWHRRLATLLRKWGWQEEPIPDDMSLQFERGWAALDTLFQEIQGLLAHARDLPARLERPSLSAATKSVTLFWECLQTVSSHAKIEAALARAIDSEALYRSFDAFLAFRADEAVMTSSALVEAWTSTSLAELHALDEQRADLLTFTSSLLRDLQAVQRNLAESVAESAEGLTGPAEHSEWLVVYHQAVEQVVTSELGIDRARTGLRSLMARLELSQDDLGRIFGVSGETIHKWERATTAIPSERRANIVSAESALRRLQDLFRPDRLAEVVRRSADLFDGESALEWILRGRIAEVADRYERALLYQA